MGEDRGSIQQGEAGDDQVDWSIHKRQRAGRLKGPAEHWDLYTGEREPGQEDHRWEPITTATTTTVGGKNGKGSLAWPVNGGGGGGGHATYGECQKNQCADRGTTSLDGCGEFMPAGDFAMHFLVVNNFLLISHCILRDHPQQKIPRELCPGRSS